jgi:branched-chain amino acid transport system permease protein
MVKLGVNFFLTLPAAILGAMILAVIIAIPSLRLKGDYFFLSTLAFQIIVFSILYNWISLTRGPYGIPGIPKPKIFGLEFSDIPQYLILAIIICLIISLIFKNLYFSPFGRVLKAIREDEIVANALGKNVTKFKILTFIISGGLAAVAGSLYASYVTYIDPTSFTLDESIFIFSIIIIGGTGNFKGPLIGTIIMIFLPEILRFLRIPDTVAANVRQIIYGLLLIIFMRIRPQGIFGEYKFE